MGKEKRKEGGKREEKGEKKKKGGKEREKGNLLLFLFPSLCSFLLFSLFPFLLSFPHFSVSLLRKRGREERKEKGEEEEIELISNVMLSSGGACGELFGADFKWK